MTSNPTSEGLVELKPVAWRYHFAGDGRAVHWTLTQRPIESRDAQPGLCATIAEPLFSEALVTSLRNQLEGAKEALREIGLIAEHNSFVSSAVEPSERVMVVLGQAFVSIQDHARSALAASTLYGLEGDQEVRASVAGLPAHVADATATDTPRFTGKEDL